MCAAWHFNTFGSLFQVKESNVIENEVISRIPLKYMVSQRKERKN